MLPSQLEYYTEMTKNVTKKLTVLFTGISAEIRDEALSVASFALNY
jgi:hypothetical protein